MFDIDLVAPIPGITRTDVEPSPQTLEDEGAAFMAMMGAHRQLTARNVIRPDDLGVTP